MKSREKGLVSLLRRSITSTKPSAYYQSQPYHNFID